MNNSATGLQPSCITPTMLPPAWLLRAWYVADSISWCRNDWQTAAIALATALHGWGPIQRTLSHGYITGKCVQSQICSTGKKAYFKLTFGGSRSSKMVDGPEDEPEGPLLVAADPQDLHGCLQLGELLSGPLFVLRLAGGTNTQSHHRWPCLILHRSLCWVAKEVPPSFKTCVLTAWFKGQMSEIYHHLVCRICNARNSNANPCCLPFSFLPFCSFPFSSQ